MVEHVLEHGVVNTVALDHSNLRRQYPEALLVGIGPERLSKRLQDLDDHGGRVAAVGPYDQRAEPGKHLLLECAAPEVRACVDDVVTVAHARDRGVVGVPVEHVLVGGKLTLGTPACDGAVLRCRNAESRHLTVVVTSGEHHRCHGVGALEVDKVRRAADRRLFEARHASETEVVELEVDGAGIAGCVEVVEDHALHFA